MKKLIKKKKKEKEHIPPDWSAPITYFFLPH